jgi:ABC-type multidrug transport system permease subunit
MTHRLLILGCKTMREGVVISAVFFAAALLLFLAATHVVPAVGPFQPIVLFLALVLIVLAPVVLISTFLISVLPGAREKLEKCEH